jgi:hypothetical protein
MVFRMGRKLQELTHAHICLTVQGISRAQRKIQLVAEASTKHLQNTYKIQNKLSLENQALVPIHQGNLQTSKENRVWRSARMEEFWMTENYFHEFRDGEKPRKSRLLHNYRKSVKSRQSSVLNRDQKQFRMHRNLLLFSHSGRRIRKWLQKRNPLPTTYILFLRRRGTFEA